MSGISIRGDINTRALDDIAVIQARAVTASQNSKFAKLSPGDKQKAKEFVTSAGLSRIQDAASRSDSAKTVHFDSKFHLDRQQRSSSRYAGKVAVQLNNSRKGYTTVGQVAVPVGTQPDPKTVSARLKHSIYTGREQPLPTQSKQDRKIANIANNERARKAKALRVAAKKRVADDRAKKPGGFKKGNGKPSSRQEGYL